MASNTTINCPDCGAALAIPQGVTQFFCTFCGAKIVLAVAPSKTEPSATTPPASQGTAHLRDIRDQASGYGVFCAYVPDSWETCTVSLQRTGSSSRPYRAQAQLRDQTGAYVNLLVGDAGMRNSAGVKALLSMYGGHLAGIDHTNYADMPDPISLADEAARNLASNLGAERFLFSHQLACPTLAAEQQRAFDHFKQKIQITSGNVHDPLVAVVLRCYDLWVAGQAWKLATFVRLEAVKDGSGLGEGTRDALGSMMGSLGSMFGGTPQHQGSAPDAVEEEDQYQGMAGFLLGGGLIGKMQRQRQREKAAAARAAQAAQSHTPAAAVPQPHDESASASSSTAWCLPDFAQYAKSGTILWSVETIATFAAPATVFDTQLKAAFIPLASSLQLHPDIESLSMMVVQQEAAQIQAATQGQLARNQAAFQAQQAAHRQMQASFDSYNQAWQARSDAQHQQFRAQTNAQFATGGTAAPDFSEAVRGVNTYVTSDGREVEVSVQADRAYENQAGDVVGTAGGFEPGADWTEINRI